MSARTDRAALSERVRELQLVLSCFSDAVIGSSALSGRLGQAYSASPSVQLPVLSKRVLVVVKQFALPIRTEAGWDAQLSGYEYRLVAEQERSELTAYHWHPSGRSHMTDPHLHLGPAPLRALGARGEIHFPTGQILFRDFATMLIRECGAKPQRRDWERVLRDSSV